MARLGCIALGLALAMAPGSRLRAGEVDGSGANGAISQAPAKADGAAAGLDKANPDKANPDKANPDKGRTLFENSGCGACHALAAAGATGQVGPPLDGDPNLTAAFVVDRVTNGQGAMPSFGGQLSDEDIAALAAYVVTAAAK